MDDSKTIWCGNIPDKVTEELLYELFLQAGPLEKVKIPTDKEGRKSNFAFISFKHQESVNYVLQLMNGIRLFDRNLNIKPRNNGSNKPQLPMMNDHHPERDQQFGLNMHSSFEHPSNRLIGSDSAWRFGGNSPRRFGKNRHPHWDQDHYHERENRHQDYKFGGFQDIDHNSSNHRRQHNRHRGHSNEKHNRRNPHHY